MSKKKVLIVDDTKTIQNMMSMVVQAMGGDVVACANDGIEAEEMFIEHEPDLTLLDIEMPRRNGVDTLRKLIAINPSSKVVMLTAMDNTVVAESCLHSGAVGYLHKDLASEEFRNGLMQHLG